MLVIWLGLLEPENGFRVGCWLGVSNLILSAIRTPVVVSVLVGSVIYHHCGGFASLRDCSYFDQNVLFSFD